MNVGQKWEPAKPLPSSIVPGVIMAQGQSDHLMRTGEWLAIICIIRTSTASQEKAPTQSPPNQPFCHVVQYWTCIFCFIPGILNLASGIVDLLQFYFPESFDRLPRDSGLFDGPKPTVLESCSVSDLAILLRGNKRKTQPIEFGAHQVSFLGLFWNKRQFENETEVWEAKLFYKVEFNSPSPRMGKFQKWVSDWWLLIFPLAWPTKSMLATS